MVLRGVICIILLGLSGCASEAERSGSVDRSTFFAILPPSYTNIQFQNRLTDTDDFNVFTYRNYYDGGGVGLGDFNGDGMLDVYFTANQTPNRLYLNEGDFWFEDVTREAGVGGRQKWATGVAVADVNGDGLLDIYVCNSGDVEGDSRENELFVNQGVREDGTPYFDEQAAAYGLADAGYATHAAFFDYDNDGDLDLYLMNNTSRPISSFTDRQIRHVRHETGGDKLFENTGGTFEDVSEKAGIYGSEIGFGLGVTVGDVNNDGWLDIYISNDFFERDYLYMNQQDGTFRDELASWMPYISQSSMGADIADIDNDGYLDLYVTDMLPDNNKRLKTTSTFDSWQAYQNGLKEDLYHQFMRNMLHLNSQGNTFSEVGLLAGVARTDWSWSPLIADFDLDGDKDIYVTNGIYRDLTNQDFIDFFGSENTIRKWLSTEGKSLLSLLDEIPSTPLPNYLFAQQEQGFFENTADAWGVESPGFSNGAAYGDLDNDGDLDLVVNNVNMDAFVYENQAEAFTSNRYVQVALEGDGANRFGIGARVIVYVADTMYMQESVPTRGFQSAVDPLITVGVGAAERIDSLVVLWPDGRVQTWYDLETNQRMIARAEEAQEAPMKQDSKAASTRLFTDITADFGAAASHIENVFNDFNRQPLSPKMVSGEGPWLDVGDVNGDGLDDFFMGGAKESAGQLWIQQRRGGYRQTNQELFARDAIAEDQGVIFFDADGDRDLDLYVASGGSEFSAMAPALQDRLYLNNGRGGFTKSTGQLPRMMESTSTVRPHDYDADGDVDLFVGGRISLQGYGRPASSYLLENDGRGFFQEVTSDVAPALENIGMVTDARWADMDGDQQADLLVALEWGPLMVFQKTGERRFTPTNNTGLDQSHGIWNRLLVTDIDGDGDQDVIAANIGKNTKITATPERPASLYVDDFDNNGRVDHILSLYEGDQSYPMLLKGDLVNAMPAMDQRFESHVDYASRTVETMFPEGQLSQAISLQVYITESSLFENRGDGFFTRTALPIDAQKSPNYGITVGDFSGNGVNDIVLAGNFSYVKPDLGMMYAGEGIFLEGQGENLFKSERSTSTGFRVSGEVRAIVPMRDGRYGEVLLVVKNNASLQVLDVVD